MNPNKEFRKKPVANTPEKFQVHDPEEHLRDMLDMMAEMGICPHCKDHIPCGCEPGGKYGRPTTIGPRRGCINCGSPEPLVGGFCNTKCQKEYVGEA